MGFLGFLRILWDSLRFSGCWKDFRILWDSWGFFGFLRILWDSFGILRIIFGICVAFSGFFGILRIFKDSLGFLGFLRILWDSLRFSGCWKRFQDSIRIIFGDFQDSLGFFGFFKDSLGFFEIWGMFKTALPIYRLNQ